MVGEGDFRSGCVGDGGGGLAVVVRQWWWRPVVAAATITMDGSGQWNVLSTLSWMDCGLGLRLWAHIGQMDVALCRL
ncbi:hypothetical protein RchiOBHm_Chr4g0430721 [Rosa chinensis]|uniref:Uncharacterized protein n=1 Tax=Rosa chinensis TaxID=74649 RepID=A0A2P6R0H8_ROSCH|nr:hypothetical protein RchiOBHm_Chr4g0430721 [Rosa chinensis]